MLQASNNSWVFVETAPILKLPRDPQPSISSLAHKALLIPQETGKVLGTQRPGTGNWNKCIHSLHCTGLPVFLIRSPPQRLVERGEQKIWAKPYLKALTRDFEQEAQTALGFSAGTQGRLD